MKAPIEPNKEDCCNNGCNPCIFDVYEKQLKLYEKYKNSLDFLINTKVNGILQSKYTSFMVTEVKDLCHSHKLIKFKRETSADRVKWRVGANFFVLYESQIKKYSRAYTPMKPSDDNCDFEIIVKIYDNGLVSKYLFNLVKGDTTLWRGPYRGYDITPNKFNSIILFAQGTGIIPFMSIIEQILSNDDDMTKVFLYYCCHSIETILFREELYKNNSYWNFSYKVYVSSNSNGTNVKYEEPILTRKLDIKDIELNLFPNIMNQYIVCGSNEFTNFYKMFLVSNDIPLENIILL